MKLLIMEGLSRLRCSDIAGFSHMGYAVDEPGNGKEGLSFT